MTAPTERYCANPDHIRDSGRDAPSLTFSDEDCYYRDSDEPGNECVASVLVPVTQWDAEQARLAELEGEVERLAHEVMAYQVGEAYQRGREHGELTVLRRFVQIECAWCHNRIAAQGFFGGKPWVSGWGEYGGDTVCDQLDCRARAAVDNLGHTAAVQGIPVDTEAGK